MPNRGEINKTLSFGESIMIPEGYHNGNGKIGAQSPSGAKTITSNGAHDVTFYATANVNVQAPTFKSARVGLSGWDHNTIDLGAPCKAGYVDITSSVGGYNNASYKKEVISVSNDNSNWTVKISHGSNPRDSGKNTAYYARIDGYRYIKYEVEYSNTNLEVSSLSYAAMV